MPYLGILGMEFENNIVMFEISTLKFVKIEFLTHTVNSCKDFSTKHSLFDVNNYPRKLVQKIIDYKLCKSSKIPSKLIEQNNRKKIATFKAEAFGTV